MGAERLHSITKAGGSEKSHVHSPKNILASGHWSADQNGIGMRRLASEHPPNQQQNVVVSRARFNQSTRCSPGKGVGVKYQ